MKLEKVWALYYSATGTTDKAVNTIAEALAETMQLPFERILFTKPIERAKEYCFTDRDIVVVGTPTYAGKIPNKMLNDFKTKLFGNGALAVPVVLFGNRNFDNSLAELCAVLENGGFHTVAAGAFVGRHAFTDKLADGRPDWDDKREMKVFAQGVSDKVKDLTGICAPVQVPGDADAPYYVPKGLDGTPAKFLKAKSKVNLSKCSNCGACARMCPMGAIDPKDVSNVPGTCIKCQACVRRCTRHARYFDDPAFLSHVAMLEENFQERKENQMFF